MIFFSIKYFSTLRVVGIESDVVASGWLAEVAPSGHTVTDMNNIPPFPISEKGVPDVL